MLESMRIRVFVDVGPTADEFADCHFVTPCDVAPPRTTERPSGHRCINTSGCGDTTLGRRSTQPGAAPVARTVDRDACV